MKVVTPSKKKEKKSPMLAITFINKFEGSGGIFGKGEKNLIIINDAGLVCPFLK